MIAKKVSMRSQQKSSMGGLIDYLTGEQDREGLVGYMTDDQGKDHRVGEVTVTNCHATNADWAAAEMRAVQAMNKRAVSDKTYHMIVSFREGEELCQDRLRNIEDRLCSALGFAGHQRISVVHHDTDNLHMHIAINKIHPRTFRLHEPYYDHRTRSKVCAELEVEFDLQRDNHAPLKNCAEANAANMTARTGLGSLLAWIKQTCQNDLEQAATWEAFNAVLLSNGLQIKQRANGFVFVAGDGTMCKASSVSRQLSMPSLLSRLGPQLAPDPHPAPKDESQAEIAPPQPTRSYQRAPAGFKVDTTALYAAYQAEQANARSLKARGRAEAAAVKNRRIEEAKRKAKLKRAAVKLVGNGLAAKIAYATIRVTLKAEINRAVQDYANERKTIQARHPLQTWQDWLKARTHDRTAQAAFRSSGRVSARDKPRAGQERGDDEQEMSR
jgi:hypothetical protein